MTLAKADLHRRCAWCQRLWFNRVWTRISESLAEVLRDLYNEGRVTDGQCEDCHAAWRRSWQGAI